MKAAIIYASVHHENTKKVVEAIAGENVVDLVDATKEKERDLSGYDLIGFASGVYYGKIHQTVLNFASVNLPANKNVFLLCTCGGSAAFRSIEEVVKSKQGKIVGNSPVRDTIPSDRSNWLEELQKDIPMIKIWQMR